MADEYERREGHHHHHRRENEGGEYGYQQPPQFQSEFGGGGYQQGGGGYQQGGYADGGYGGVQPVQQTAYPDTYATDQGITQSRTDAQKHKHEEEAAGLGGLAAGAYALYEGHEAKKDPANARRHKLEEELGGAGAVGAEGFALYEHHKEKKDKNQLSDYEKQLAEEEGGQKKHHGFFG